MPESEQKTGEDLGPQVSLSRLTLSYAAIYLIWGSTYLAMRLAVQSIPPFLMIGLCQGIGGGLLYLFLRFRGAPKPVWSQWRGAIVLGVIFLVLGEGSAAWALQRIESSLAALIMAMIPLFTVLFESLGLHAKRQTLTTTIALLTGISGVGILVWPKLFAGQAAVLGVVAMLFSAACWAWGGILSKHTGAGQGSRLFGSMQMVAAAAILIPLVLPVEWHAFEFSKVSPASWLGLSILIVFNSWIAYGAFQWLLKVEAPVRVATYAYVNPIVAVWLGWWVLDEPLTPRILLASLCVLISVAVVLRKLPGDLPTGGAHTPHG